jgi:hypothetical protein
VDAKNGTGGEAHISMVADNGRVRVRARSAPGPGGRCLSRAPVIM